MTPAETGEAAHTLDAFHRGDFWLVQPASSGHRAGMDAMILAAAVPGGFAGNLADLGAGAGAAGFAVAARCPDARVTLVENAPEMVAYAERSVAHPQNARIAGRVRIVQADVTLTGKARTETGLGDGSFDYAIMNPPFNTARDRATPDPLKRAAHVMSGEDHAAWIRTAAAIVKPRGGLALIFRPGSLAAVLEALDRRFGGAMVLPVYPRADQPAIRIVVRAVRASRAGVSVAPPLVLHRDAGGGFTDRADAINNGRASLFDD